MIRWRAARIVLCLVAPTYAYAAHTQLPEPELLDPDKAFVLSTRVLDAQTLEARWKIADGYYMYRDKFRFEPVDDSVVLQTPVFPAGKVKDDPLFGTVVTYIGEVAVQLPFARRNQDADGARLRITAQGCNEPVGVCYPPITKEVNYELPPMIATVTRAATAKITSLQSLRDLVGGDATGEFLPPDQAFVLEIDRSDAAQLRARFVIADGYYLYRDKTRFTLTEPSGEPAKAVKLGDYVLPPGKPKVDEYFGKTEVYYHGLEIGLPLRGVVTRTARLQLHATYQGCADQGICYPPIKKRFAITLDANGIAKLTAVTIEGDASPMASPGLAVATPTTPAGRNITTRVTGSFLLAVLGAFATGLLLTFTPCVLPMIPIVSGIIVGQADKEITKLRGGALAATYVLGTAVTYTAIGAVAGATGDQLQAYFQNPWAIALLAAVFVAMALSMFGLYELQMPSFIQSRVHTRLQGLRGGTLTGVFLLGLVSALIVGACVSPLLISVLSVAIVSKNPLLGAAIMFTMALGMGVILIAVGLGASFLLPKAGAWMERVKQVFGVLLVAVAIYLLGLIPQVPVLLLWGAFFIVVAVYLGATQTLPSAVSGWRYLWKGVGTFLLVWGVLALIGGLTGSRDLLRPLPATLSTLGLTPVAGSAAPTTQSPRLFERISTVRALDERLEAARRMGRPVLIDYYADWCTDCLRMERTTFADPRVRQVLSDNFVLLQLDVTDAFSPETAALKQRFGVYGPPATLFLSANGEERRELRFYGYRSAEAFLAIVRQAAKATVAADR
jgi:thiol:disulfide interchange protein DsbD